MLFISVDDLLSDGNIRMEADAGLASSIREDGVLVPIEVYRTSENATCFYVKDGHRRLASAIQAGLNEVPCVEVEPPADRPEQLAHQYIINEQRKGLSQLERARVYQRLIQEFDWKQNQVAVKFGVSEAEVSLALAALRAHPDLRDAILSGKLSPSAAEPVLSLPYEDQGKIAPMVVQAKTVRKVVDTVKAYRKAQGVVSPKRSTAHRLDASDALALAALENASTSLSAAMSQPLNTEEARAQALYLLDSVLRLADELRSNLENTPIGDAIQIDVSWDELANL